MEAGGRKGGGGGGLATHVYHTEFSTWKHSSSAAAAAAIVFDASMLYLEYCTRASTICMYVAYSIHERKSTLPSPSY